MPNKNKTFTCNLFLPLEADLSFATIKTSEDFHKFMGQYFPELADTMIHSPDSLNENNIGRLLDVKCYPWVFNNFCLFGDGAHHIFPYFGQGLNIGLEDCTIIAELIDKYDNNWQTITKEFQILRKPNADAITDLSKTNFHQLKA